MPSPVLYSQKYSGYGGKKPPQHCVYVDGLRFVYSDTLKTFAIYIPGKYGERGGSLTLAEYLKRKQRKLQKVNGGLATQQQKTEPKEIKISGVRIPRVINGKFADGSNLSDYISTNESFDEYNEFRDDTIASLHRGDIESAYSNAYHATAYAFYAFILAHLRGERTEDITDEVTTCARLIDSTNPSLLFFNHDDEQERAIAKEFIRRLPVSVKSRHLNDQFTPDYHALPVEQKLLPCRNKQGALVSIDGYISSVLGDKSVEGNPYNPDVFRDALVTCKIIPEEIAKYDKEFNRFDHDTKHFDPLTVLSPTSRGAVVSFLFKQNIDGAIDLIQTLPDVFKDTKDKVLSLYLNDLKDGDVPIIMRNDIAQRILEYAAVRDDKGQREYQKELADQIHDLHCEIENLYELEEDDVGLPSYSLQYEHYIDEQDAADAFYQSDDYPDTNDPDKILWSSSLDIAMQIFSLENASFLDKAYVLRRIVRMARFKTDDRGVLSEFVYSPPLTEKAKERRDHEWVNLCALIIDKKRQLRMNKRRKV